MSRAPPLAEGCEPTHEPFGLKLRVWGAREEAQAGGTCLVRRESSLCDSIRFHSLSTFQPSTHFTKPRRAEKDGERRRPSPRNLGWRMSKTASALDTSLPTRPVNPAPTANDPNRGGDGRRHEWTSFMLLAFHRPNPLPPADLSHLVVHIAHGPGYTRGDNLKGGAEKVMGGRRSLRTTSSRIPNLPRTSASLDADGVEGPRMPIPRQRFASPPSAHPPPAVPLQPPRHYPINRDGSDKADNPAMYKDLTEIITSTALKVFGHAKAFVVRKEEITNDKIKGIIGELRAIGGAIRFERSTQAIHLSSKALEHYKKAARSHQKSKSGGSQSIHNILTHSRKSLHKILYAETSKEIVQQAKEADKRRITMALRGSTKKMIQSSSYVPLPLAVNDLDEPEKLICNPDGVKATTRQYFTRLYDHTYTPQIPKPWMETSAVKEVKARVLNDPFQWPQKATLPDFRAMIRRGNHRPSPGPDKWEKWVIKSLSDAALTLVLDLHNYEVMNSCFPGTVNIRKHEKDT
ncbi:hypothetical protein GALMADRAFT_162465 [Galerina marginata CBS 339.88]|uniref:Uncharacterized protein n=1 Tax=Galerina marginata (strain CBS 339.88) TaxID=685588 RepID=A0A067S313_GALM3|nr:hypothetical protein GALMADRAFT_162465 [Galerina marginata CBS 339.88]